LLEITDKTVAYAKFEISPRPPQKSYFVGIPYSLEMIGTLSFCGYCHSEWSDSVIEESQMLLVE